MTEAQAAAFVVSWGYSSERFWGHVAQETDGKVYDGNYKWNPLMDDIINRFLAKLDYALYLDKLDAAKRATAEAYLTARKAWEERARIAAAAPAAREERKRTNAAARDAHEHAERAARDAHDRTERAARDAHDHAERAARNAHGLAERAARDAHGLAERTARAAHDGLTAAAEASVRGACACYVNCVDGILTRGLRVTPLRRAARRQNAAALRPSGNGARSRGGRRASVRRARQRTRRGRGGVRRHDGRRGGGDARACGERLLGGAGERLPLRRGCGSCP